MFSIHDLNICQLNLYNRVHLNPFPPSPPPLWLMLSRKRASRWKHNDVPNQNKSDIYSVVIQNQTQLNHFGITLLNGSPFYSHFKLNSLSHCVLSCSLLRIYCCWWHCVCDKLKIFNPPGSSLIFIPAQIAATPAPWSNARMPKKANHRIFYVSVLIKFSTCNLLGIRVLSMKLHHPLSWWMTFLYGW